MNTLAADFRVQPRIQTPDFLGAAAPLVISAALDPLCGRPLDRPIRTFMESRFGRSFKHVRIHTGSWAAAAARALRARAFTLGAEIFFGARGYDPRTATGMRLLAHELAHTVQQGVERGGLGTYPIGAPTDALEDEADRVAEQVLTSRRLLKNSPFWRH